jgi:hypothetical protein
MKLKIFALLIVLLPIIMLSSCKDNSTSPSEKSSNMSLVGSYNTPDYAYDVSILTNNTLTYAFIADGTSGLQIVNVTNPALPAYVSNYDTPGSAIAVFSASFNNSQFAFVSDGTQGLVIVNVTNISVPVQDTTLYFQNDAVLTSFVDVPNGVLYIGTYYGNIYLYNVSNLPNTISLISAYTSPLDNIMGIYVLEGIAYVAERSIGIELINVSNPSNPQNISSYNTPGNSYDIVVGGYYAYVADATSLYVIDVTNPFNPVYAGMYAEENATYFGVALNYPYQVYTADYDYGVETLGLGTPSSPAQVGYYNTNGFSNNLAYYNGRIYAADGSDGLIILKYQ